MTGSGVFTTGISSTTVKNLSGSPICVGYTYGRHHHQSAHTSQETDIRGRGTLYSYKKY